jgi:hypothetical protein
LQFVEFNPPSIKELTTIQPSLSYIVSRAASQGIRYRVAGTGEWKFISLSTAKAVHYDQTGNLWYGSNATVTNRNGTTSQAVNNSVLAITSNINNDIIVGGGFTTPFADIMGYNGSAWVGLFNTAPPNPINGVVRALLFGNDGNLYIGGDFTAPNSFITKYSYTTLGVDGGYVNIGALSGPVRALINGLDGNIYVGGDGGVQKFNPTTLTFTDIAPGINAGVNSLALLPDGRIVAGGAFTIINGVACNLVAVYNGTKWQPLGGGINGGGEVTKLAVNKSTGEVYATGVFSASGTVNLPSGFAKFNGTNWIQSDITNGLTVGTKGALTIRSSDNELALASDNTPLTLTNGASNAVNYTGTADVFPQIKFTGPGTIWAITNYTTGKAIYFYNYTLLPLETATFTHDPTGGITFVSSFYGNVIGRILPGSDKTQFSLVPGQTNYIVPYVTGGTGATKVELIYQNTHWSFEAGAGAS